MSGINDARQRAERELRWTAERVRDVLLAERNGRREHGKEGRPKVRHSCLFHVDPVASADFYWDEGWYYCHACGVHPLDDVVAELELYEATGPSNNGRRRRADKPRSRPPDDQIVATYDYQGEDGELLFQTVRYNPKDFRQRRPDGRGGWIWNMKGVRRVPYRLPGLLDADPDQWVFICAGEKDVETLVEHGEVATTNPMGEGKWLPEFNQYFRDHFVVILPHQDEAGEAHGEDVRRNLLPVAHEVRVANVPRGKDITEFCELGGTDEELDDLLDASAPKGPTRPESSTKRSSTGYTLLAVGELLTEDEDEDECVVEGLLFVGEFSTCQAKPKVGKSTLVRQLAACVAQGDDFLGRKVMQGPVIYLSIEEHRRQVRQHFRALIHDLTAPLHIHFGATPEDAVRQLGKLIEQIKPVLVIIDPLFKFVRGVKDESAYIEVTRALEPVLDLARETGVHLLATHHNKKRGDGSGDDTLGSTSIFGNVDVAILLSRKQDDTRTIKTEGRHEDMPLTVLSMDETGGLYLAGSAGQYERERIHDAVLSAIRNAPVEGLGRDEVVDKVGMRKVAVVRALDELTSAGKVLHSGDGKRGNPHRWWWDGPRG